MKKIFLLSLMFGSGLFAATNNDFVGNPNPSYIPIQSAVPAIQYQPGSFSQNYVQPIQPYGYYYQNQTQQLPVPTAIPLPTVQPVGINSVPVQPIQPYGYYYENQTQQLPVPTAMPLPTVQPVGINSVPVQPIQPYGYYYQNQTQQLPVPTAIPLPTVQPVGINNVPEQPIQPYGYYYNENLMQPGQVLNQMNVDNKQFIMPQEFDHVPFTPIPRQPSVYQDFNSNDVGKSLNHNNVIPSFASTRASRNDDVHVPFTPIQRQPSVYQDFNSNDVGKSLNHNNVIPSFASTRASNMNYSDQEKENVQDDSNELLQEEDNGNHEVVEYPSDLPELDYDSLDIATTSELALMDIRDGHKLINDNVAEIKNIDAQIEELEKRKNQLKLGINGRIFDNIYMSKSVAREYVKYDDFVMAANTNDGMVLLYDMLEKFATKGTYGPKYDRDALKKLLVQDPVDGYQNNIFGEIVKNDNEYAYDMCKELIDILGLAATDKMLRAKGNYGEGYVGVSPLEMAKSKNDSRIYELMQLYSLESLHKDEDYNLSDSSNKN